MASDDAVSTSGLTTMSETDHIMFTVLSNVERVDLSAISRLPNAAPEVRIEELPDIPEEVPPPARPPSPYEPYRPASDMPAEAPQAPPEPPLPHAPEVPPEVPRIPQETPDMPPERPPPEDVPPEEVSPPERRPFEETRVESETDILTKQTILCDLQKMEMQGVRLSKVWTIDDRLEDLMLEMRRHTLAMDERANVNMMRDGMRLMITGIEMVNNRIGLLDLEGWSSDVCRDLNKHDANLGRIYRKYWKRSTSTSPEMDIALSLLGSMGIHHMKRTMSKQLVSGASARNAGFGNAFRFSRRDAPTPVSSDDEAPPP